MPTCTIIRSRRKTVALHINEDAQLEVRAPLKMPQADIDRFVVNKRGWIEKHLALRESENEQRAAFVLNYGDTVFLQGQAYPITAQPGNRVGFDGSSFYIPPNLPPQEVKQVVIQIYKLAAKRILTNKVVEYAQRMNLNPAAVKINSAKTRWGSCSSARNINFSWRLVLADDAVIDYVVVHELAHLLELNHAEGFWGIVEAVLPDYRERKKRLKELQKRLAVENWEYKP